ncbi:MAG: glycosyltransferase family 2 protein [Candidatus Peribacteraceae bacterium]|nr:glycosyltransferase family 2 protein [Candidatus Peribacteraceae bacterium]MDD5739351.1 glycosyltransferase family 2 protein [Candidatus Peribacteraceae bacterium]
MLSLIIPVFNEASNLRPLYEELKESLSRLHLAAEILFVDDASTDATPEIIRELKSTDPRIRGFRLAQNSDKGGALAIGLREARGDIVITMDGDLQNDPADIPLLLAALEQGADFALGWRKRRADSLPKRLASWLFNAFVGTIFNVKHLWRHFPLPLRWKNETHTEKKPNGQEERNKNNTQKSPETRRCGGDSGGGHRRSAFFHPFFVAPDKERIEMNQKYLSEEMIPSIRLHDANTGFKALKRETMLSVPLTQGLFRFLSFILAKQGLTITEVPVHHRPRKNGRTKFRLARRVLSLWKLHKALRAAATPLTSPESLPAYTPL